MDREVFSAFVKHAMMQNEMPEDYLPTRTAILQMFPKLADKGKKLPNPNPPPTEYEGYGPGWENGYNGKPLMLQDTKTRSKTAGLGVAGAEVAGLGILARPSLQTLRHPGTDAEQRSHAKHELAGLGVLAAHPAYEIGSHFAQKLRPAAGRIIAHH